MHILVTGGAGYVGSNVAHALVEAGHRVSVLDDLSSGHRAAVHAEARLTVGGCGDHGALDEAAAGGLPESTPLILVCSPAASAGQRASAGA